MYGREVIRPVSSNRGRCEGSTSVVRECFLLTEEGGSGQGRREWQKTDGAPTLTGAEGAEGAPGAEGAEESGQGWARSSSGRRRKGHRGWGKEWLSMG